MKSIFEVISRFVMIEENNIAKDILSNHINTSNPEHYIFGLYSFILEKITSQNMNYIIINQIKERILQDKPLEKLIEVLTIVEEGMKKTCIFLLDQLVTQCKD